MGESSSSSWSSLPPQCLRLICTKLPDIADFVRLRAVCTSWRSFVSPSENFPRLPYILINDMSYREREGINLYSFASGKTYTIIGCPEKHCWLWGPGDGYVFCSRHHRNGSNNSLLNPLTGKQIPLPPFDTVHWRPSRIIPKPSSSNNCVTVFSNYYPAKVLLLASCRPGDEEWAITHCPQEIARGTCTYFEGFHFIDRDGMTGTDTLIIDDVDGAISAVVKGPEGCTSHSKDYLVESDGQILRIFYTYDDKYNTNQFFFIIHKLDFDMEGNNYRWIEIENIGDRILFLEMVSGFSLRSSDFPGLPGNCIYFINSSPDGAKLRRYNLEDSTVEVLPYPPGKWGSWIVPSLC